MVNYTGEAVNLSEDWQTELLRCAEYGAGLSFAFMAEDAKVLQDTLHTGYYGASYEAWAEDAMAIMTAYQADMAGLNGLAMTDHEILAKDVKMTVYEDGSRVYVNYGLSDYTDGAKTIPARSYRVVKGE